MKRRSLFTLAGLWRAAGLRPRVVRWYWRYASEIARRWSVVWRLIESCSLRKFKRLGVGGDVHRT
jgi:hypothetical protein